MEEDKSGFIIVNKPSGITSHDVVSRLRRITGIKKIGHAGTLDPFASGVLVCAIERMATKRIREFMEMDKEYAADVFLGARTDTFDRDGKITVGAHSHAPQQLLEKTVKEFIGKIKQVPPMYSATKIRGKKMYELARQGIKIDLGPSDVEIYDIKILEYKWPLLKLKVKCGTGTYIRSLANDIGEKMGCGGYLQELVRTAIGDFKIEDSVGFDELNESNWESKLIRLGAAKE